MITRSFAVINKDEGIRALSSSGGFFYALAEKVILDGGVVFGAAFDENWQVNHVVCDKVEDLLGLMKSKYVQSSIGNCYRETRTFLQSNRKILFCGTPCQIQGLLSFLDKSLNNNVWHNNLITIDFICHGVPSRMVWRKYIKELAQREKIHSINFRDKTKGWREFGLKVEFANGTYYIGSQKQDPFLRGFLQNLFLRESCYECRFRGVDRESDFTMGDFWGVYDYLPEFFDDKGTSIVLTHNDKAFGLLNSMKSKLVFKEIDIDIVVKTNSPLVRSVIKHNKREEFLMDIDKTNISRSIIKCLKAPILKRVERKVKNLFHLE